MVSIAELDNALITRIGRRDTAALGLLFDRYGAWIYGITRLMAPSAGKDTLDDLVAEVFRCVWHEAAAYPADGPPRLWLWRQVRACIRAARSRAGLLPAEGDEDEIAVALRGVSPVEREVVWLACVQGLSYQEIAARLDRPVPAVLTQMRNGLHTLTLKR